MGEERQKELILEAIDQLRGRKARPDLERICSLVWRRHGVDPKTCRLLLQRLVDQQAVVKVEYKGSFSYRNAAKWSKFELYRDRAVGSDPAPAEGRSSKRAKRPINIAAAGNNNHGRNNNNNNDSSNGDQSNSDRTSRLLRDAVSTILLTRPELLAAGVPLRDIQQRLVDTRFSQGRLQMLLQRELNAGKLVQTYPETYILSPDALSQVKQRIHQQQQQGRQQENGDEEAPAGSSNNASLASVGMRRKRARKVFDPSDHEHPRKRGRPAGSKNKQSPSPAPSPAAPPSPAPLALAPPPPPVAAANQTSPPTLLPNPAESTNGGPPPSRPPPSPQRRPRGGCKTGRGVGRPPGKANKAPPAVVVEPESSKSEHCQYCQQTAESNKRGEYEELLVCKDCRLKAHPSCLEYSEELALRSRMSPWQCMDCKTCSLCKKSHNAETLLVCDLCDKGFHMACHRPEVMEKPRGKWICTTCKDDSNGAIRNHSTYGAGGLPTPRESPVSDSPVDGDTPDPTIPDASEWTPSMVETYFKCQGFSDEWASAFQKQEIDGPSLLMMQRLDVLTVLGIKLGPALKMWRLVHQLQTRRRDHSLPSWMANS